MEQTLHMVSGSEFFFLLDGFSGYKQALVADQDRIKNTFRTKWGNFAYRRIPFSLINVGATFQRKMDIAFQGLIDHSVVVYLDDVTIFSKKREYHVFHLNFFFDHCRKYNISLNPKKSIFMVLEGKLLGHIISNKGISIDTERIEAISHIPLPHNSFMGTNKFCSNICP